MDRVCYIIVGVSGSGKSTLVNQLKSQLDDYCVFSLDDVRVDMYSLLNEYIPDDKKTMYSAAFSFVNQNQEQFNKYVDERWKSALKHVHVIVDNTHLTRKSRARWIQDARSKGFKIVVFNVMTPLQVVLDRQSSRADKAVPADVVRDMYMRLQEVQADEYDVLINYDGVRGTQ